MIPIYDYAINRSRTYVFVKTENNEIYRCCSWHDTKDWVKQDNYQIENKSDKLNCANEIRKKWKISKNTGKAANSLSLGWGCDVSGVSNQYSSYQIEQNGTIRGRTVQENFLTEYFGLFSFLCILPLSLMFSTRYLFKGQKKSSSEK